MDKRTRGIESSNLIFVKQEIELEKKNKKIAKFRELKANQNNTGINEVMQPEPIAIGHRSAKADRPENGAPGPPAVP